MNQNYYFLLALVISLFGFLTGLAKESFSASIVLMHFASAGILFLVATVKVLLNFKKEKSKLTRILINLVLGIVILVGLSLWQSWLNKQKYTWDLSQQKVYSLASESTELLAKLKKPLTLFFMDDFNPTTRQEADRLLGLYAKASPLIKYQIVDPRKAKQLRSYLNPEEASFLYFEYGEGKEALVGKTKTFTEVEISKSIYRLVAGAKGKVYYAFGHGEPSPELEDEAGLSEMMQALQGQNYELHGLILGSGKQIPTDARLVILASGTKDYLPNEIEMLQDYLSAGGNLLALDDPENKIDFNSLISNYGIKIERAVAIDQQRLLHDGPEVGWQVIVNDFAEHPVTQQLKDRKAAIFLIASILSEIDHAKGKVTPLLKTSNAAWGETDLEILNSEEPKAVFDPKKDYLGPVTLAMAYEGEVSKDANSKDQRIVVFSDLEWLVNANLDIYANKELFIRTVNWLVGEQEDLKISSRFLESTSMMPIGKSDYQKVFLLALIIPEILLILLLSISYRRKNS